MKRWSQKVLKGLGLILVTPLLLLALGLGTLWFFPGLFINTANLQRFERFAHRWGLRWSAEDLALSAHSRSFFRKEMLLRSQNLCVVYSESQENLCFKNIDVEIEADFSGWGFRQLYFKKLHLSAESLRYSLNPSDQKSNEKEDSEPGPRWAWLERLRFGDWNVEVPRFSLQSKEDELVFCLELRNKTDSGFYLKGESKSREKKSFRNVELAWQSDFVEDARQLFRVKSADLRADLGQKKLATLRFSGERFDAEHASVKGIFHWQDPKTKVQLHLDLFREWERLELRTHGSVALPEYLRAPLEIRSCLIRARVGEAGRGALIPEMNLACGVELKTAWFVKDRRSLAVLPPKVDAKVTGELKTQGAQEDLKGFVHLELGPLVSRFSEGGLQAHYEIDLGRKGTPGSVQVKSNLAITDFKKFAALANGAGLLIPSPVNVLEGRVGLKLDGAFELRPLEGKLDVELSTDLATRDQALDLKANGTLRVLPCRPPHDSTLLEVDLVATQMKIKLPNIDYKRPPALLPDSRFVKETKVSKPKKPTHERCPFRYALRFRNLKQSPILIQGPIVKNAIPLQVDVRAVKDKDPQGFVRIENFSTELFRRKATVQNFDLALDTRVVTGRFRVDYPEYKIFINLSGTTKSLRLDFESDPPMERQQVLAILLFGRPIEGLDESQSGSVNNADAAAKDGALSLASLYIFASTPIESVGYNPHTQGLTAKVRVANGTTLNVGANEQGLTDIGVTRRLSKHWRIQTTVKDPTEEGEESASTLLEWFTRF